MINIDISGWVYFIKADNGLCKIGMSKHPKERIRKLGIVLPYTLHAILLLKTTNPRQLEREIHELFEEKRVRGEWFKLDKQDIEYFVEDWHSPVWNIGACYHA